jgi:hypothetical protein
VPDGKAPEKKKKHFNLMGILLIGGVFTALMLVLLVVQENVRYSVRSESLTLLPKDELIRLKNEILERDTLEKRQAECLLVIEENDDALSMKAQDMMIPMLREMRVAFDICNTDEFTEEKMNQYRKIIIAVTHYHMMPDALLPIQSWVRNGGNLMIMYAPLLNGSFQSLAGILGIKDSAEPVMVEGLHFTRDFMLGGTRQDYVITDPFDSSLGLAITSDCEVYLESTDEYPAPLIWRKKTGKGTVVFDNFGIMEKSYRGIHWAAYTLLDDWAVYPVINGATFYIDDFPSPIPDGDGQYIQRDFGMSIADFYSRVWWNDVYDLARKNGIPYTGLTIEVYSNQVEGELEQNTEVTRFQYYGNMLLRIGGEIGIHGYNHMPLVLDNFDYEDQYDEYRQWPSREDMVRGVEEILRFTQNLFPQEELQVYVPPSNILSEEGREVLGTTSVRAIGSVYLEGDLAYEQEFDVSAKDGIVNTPRIISGYDINPFMQLTAMSELNYHLVSTHFQHPDDVLDEDRGAAKGWNNLLASFKKYIDWLYASFPQIRNLTGAELAAAVERYDLLRYEVTKTENGLALNLTNFMDEAWMMLRLNSGRGIASASGAEYSQVAEGLYLLECGAAHVEITLEQDLPEREE